jgi:hypothetical protein
MKGLLASAALVLLAVSVVGLRAADSETFIGVAGATGTFKRPLLIVDGKRYELKASDTADAKVAEMLEKFSKGDTGTYAVKGTRGTVNGNDGIIVDSITPAKANPGTGAPASPKRPGYKVYDHAIKATPPPFAENKAQVATGGPSD